MKKRSMIIRAVCAVVIIALMVPTFLTRIKSEAKNNNVVLALSLNNTKMALSSNELNTVLKENLDIGVNTAIIGEESGNTLINTGMVTIIQYNVLCHKYDDESEVIVEALKKNKRVHNNSLVIITRRDEAKEYLAKWIPARYNSDEYLHLTTPYGGDVYVLYDETGTEWQMMIGFDEEKLEIAKESGFEIALAMLVADYKNTEYISLVEDLIKKYDVKYLNLKNNSKCKDPESKDAKKNYKAFCKLIEKYKLTLILTENLDQLSNNKPNGYEKLIESADGRVVRNYDTVDYVKGNTGVTQYETRYYQILNSVMDRNIRFVSITQLTNGNSSALEKAQITNKATRLVKDKLTSAGFNITNEQTCVSGYSVHRRFVSALALLLMILMWLTIIELLARREIKPLQIAAAICGVLGAIATFVMPEALVLLYSSLFALTAPCFAITVLFLGIEALKDKMGSALLCAFSMAASLLLVIVNGFVQSALLSGHDYYINTLIFRGIKLSLIVPILFAVATFAIYSLTDSHESLLGKIKKILTADIKVYWVILFLIAALVGGIYIMRSGNVESISGVEAFMRNKITQFMPARPRTKEFLIGWPCVLLLAYFIKNTNNRLVHGVFMGGASILFASAINSFCHVFTNALTIYSRTINGFVIGVVCAVIALAAVMFLIAFYKRIKKVLNNEAVSE
ncbi:MAG: DUF5693 family protein [Clostridia bacterium]|nr:DUF5693 family protein [Clostridia bacterium]